MSRTPAARIPAARLAPAVLASVLGSVLGSLAAIPAGAQETAETPAETTAETTGDTLVLDTITVSGDSETSGYQPLTSSTATGVVQPILDAPQSIAVVSQQVLRDQSTFTLDGALANVSGVTQANTLGGTQDAFIRRGFGDNRDGSTLTNGLRTALPRSFNATTERVEVLKGPSSALYGILDPGGLVNLVTKTPQQTFGGSIQAYGTSFGGGGGYADVTGPIAGTPLSYRLIGSFEDTDYWKDFGSIRRDMISPSLTWRNETTALTASYLHEDYSVPFDRGTVFDLETGRPVDIPPKHRLDEPFNVTKGDTDVATLALEHAFSENWGVNARYAYSRNFYGDYQARVVNFQDGLITRDSDGTQSAYAEVQSGRIDFAGDVETGRLRHQLLFGGSYDLSDVLRTDILRCPGTVGYPVADYENWPPLEKCGTVSDMVSDQVERLETWSLYAQDSISVTDKLILTGGVRYQVYDVYSGRGRPFLVATDGDGDAFVPRLAAVYRLRPDVSLFATWAKSFKPQSSTTQIVGALDPEEGDSYEAGVKYESAAGLTLTASAYHILKSNVVFGSGEELEVSKEVRSQGVELDFAGQLTDRASVIGSYGYTDAETTAGEFEGKAPPNVAAHTASIFAAYSFDGFRPGDSLRLGAGVRGQSGRPGNGDNTYFLPGYGVVDAFAAYTFDTRRPLTLQLNLKNVLDKVYYASSIGTNNYANAIGEPFQAVLSLRVDL